MPVLVVPGAVVPGVVAVVPAARRSAVDDVVAGVRDRAPRTNVVLTGRDAPDEIVDLADTVTEMRKVKHAYDQGIKAKKGIDY